MSVAWAYTLDPLRDSRHPDARAAREQTDWLLWLELGGLSARTISDYRKATNVLLREFPHKPFNQVTDGDLLHVARLFPPTGRRVRMAGYVSWFGWGYQTRRLDENPMLRMPKQKRPGKKWIETFTDAEVERFCSLPLPDGPLLTVMFESGIRKSECRHLRVMDYKPDSLADAPHGRLVVLDGKGGKDRVITVSKRLKEALGYLVMFENLSPPDYLWYGTNAGNGYRKTTRATPIVDSAFANWWTRVTAAAGIEYVKRPRTGSGGRGNPHATRHTYATNWLRRGGRLETLSIQMGHASIKTTFDLYGHLDHRDVARDLALIEAGE